jgi:O-antigen ligase
MTELFILAYFICFCILAWKNFSLAIGFLIIFLPAYLIRFNIGPIPSTILEINFFAIFLVWFTKHAKTDLPIIFEIIKRYRFLFIFTFLLITSAFISCFLHPIPLRALAIWRAYFLEPILLFVIIIGHKKNITADSLIKYLMVTGLGVSILAIIQKITGQFYPPSLWNDELFGRATSFFTSPNAVGLFLVPIFLLSLPLLQKYNPLALAHAILATVAIGLTMSQGAWIAFLAGIIIYLFFINYKKTALAITVFCAIAVFSIPALKSAVFFEDQAGQNRLTLWRYSAEYLTESPQNFLLGAGLRRFFYEVQQPHYDVKQMERLIYPHNIFLNFWLETGLAGAIAFVGLIICSIIITLRNKNYYPAQKAAFMAVMGALIIHGLVDAPYFKNDLSMLFWIIIAIIILASQKKLSAVNG